LKSTWDTLTDSPKTSNATIIAMSLTTPIQPMQQRVAFASSNASNARTIMRKCSFSEWRKQEPSSEEMLRFGVFAEAETGTGEEDLKG
jgi:hypothetical protein